MEEQFTSDALFVYNLQKKRMFYSIAIGLVVSLLLLVGYYMLFLKESSFIFALLINEIINHISTQLSNATLLASFYTSFLGGLFFVVMPVEPLFVYFLKAGHNPIALIAIYIFGFFISYTINYYIGMKLGGAAKKIISAKKFYALKGVINRYGSFAVLGFNAIPFLPSQPVATILGVFKYNKARFYTFFFIGQFLKYTGIVLVYYYIM